MSEVKLTGKQKLISQILEFTNAGYSENDCKEMKVPELKNLLADLKKEANTPVPDLNDQGEIVLPELPPEPEPSVKKERKPREASGPSKRDVLYAVFDSAHAENGDLKKAAKLALPETSDGVIASYLCYWRKDRGIASTRSFGNSAPKLTPAEKVRAAIVKQYGENYDLSAVMAEVAALPAVETESQAE